MRRLTNTTAALICSALMALPAFAEEKPAAPPAPPPGPGGMGEMKHEQGMGMMRGMDQKPMDAMLRQMQEHQIKMHDLLHQIREAKDEKQRERLKEEQRNLMKDHMENMRGHGPMMQQHPPMQGMPPPGDKPSN
ncbi:hypothetical protein [Methylogaea oryzae]|uniref:Uncharacterized protein n=1 Tax=Methylogaea oryzae TaxID=1295382 RepID=A0A8D4VM10_9GAMM|nr:hypothetical protein [Methylogaea oryzae]BBL70295.1 hypothetical protein MoryE10_09010 [Methylogaea oryzae]